MSELTPSEPLVLVPREARAWVESLVHDLRTPLTVLLTEAYLLRSRAELLPPTTDGDVRARLLESARAIEDSAERLGREIRARARVAWVER